jgi:hypothetical protein
VGVAAKAWHGAASLIQMERNGVSNQIYHDRTLLVLETRSAFVIVFASLPF